LLVARLIAIGVLVSACSAGSKPTASFVPKLTTEIVGGVSPQVAWLAGGQIVIEVFPTGSSDGALWTLDPSTNALAPIDNPLPSGCIADTIHALSALSDGRLAFASDCFSGLPSPPTTTIRTYNPADSQIADLAPGLGITDGVAWDVKTHSGLLSHGDQLCEGIVAVTPSGVRPMTGTFTVDGDTFDLADGFTAGSVGCTDTGRASGPALNPTSGDYAVLASAGSSGASGMARLNLPWNVYEIDPAGRALGELASDLTDARELQWSPDGRWLAVIGSLANDESVGWLINPATGIVTPFSADPFSYMAWAPDSRHILAISDQDAAGKNKLWTYDVSTITLVK
jgi:WD40 repeat protein